jgi:hypothetical protein
VIYAIRVGSDGPVKIGRATNPIARMAELQTAHATPLNLLAAVRWPDEIEGELHRALGADRLQGEWFKPTDTVLWVVEKMRDVDSVHEVFYRFFPDHYFPWMAASEEPNAMPYLSELISRTDSPIPIISCHSKWPA